MFTRSWASFNEYLIQRRLSLSRMSPWHDHRQFDARLLSLVCWGMQPSGLQPEYDVLVSYPVASTATIVLSRASTRADIGAACYTERTKDMVD